ncbi:DUF805 domain-containing protein [Maricaulis sp.]|uniref:DUF805 domain-containing protein n=1 Tax=Maricaulis sp. TaxID=1486257 RepID=UPI003A92FEC1
MMRANDRPEQDAPSGRSSRDDADEDSSAWHYAGLAFHKYLYFDGRARRKEFWSFITFGTLFTIAPPAIIMSLVYVLLVTAGRDYSAVAYFLFPFPLMALGLMPPALAVMVRRLHDIGLSGWSIFIGLIPVFGQLMLLGLMLVPSQPSFNKYGPVPKPMPHRGAN